MRKPPETTSRLVETQIFCCFALGVMNRLQVGGLDAECWTSKPKPCIGFHRHGVCGARCRRVIQAYIHTTVCNLNRNGRKSVKPQIYQTNTTKYETLDVIGKLSAGAAAKKTVK